MAIIDTTPGVIPRIDGLDNDHIKQAKNLQLTLSSFGSQSQQTIIQQIVTIVTSSTTYYKRGYRTSTGQFEYWMTNVRDDGPPSGNQLIDITVVNEVKEC